MRVFAISDIHIDHVANRQWVENLPIGEYGDDVLILAGDVSDAPRSLEWCFTYLARRFRHVLYVPGNHELWVIRDPPRLDSLEKFQQVCALARRCGISTGPVRRAGLSIVPLLSWYDYSFGAPDGELLAVWMDYRACRWPEGFAAREVAQYFFELNEAVLTERAPTLISFSHFLPRIDLMPGYIPQRSRLLYPVLGSTRLELQIRRLKPAIHVYGHSHVNRRVRLDDTVYINNALGYPHEGQIASRRLTCVYED
jgi:predicted phosphodiesterase